ncbi:hypothetical protein [Halolamina rubra]|uniref:hypothetical protein n=1 Tax=Halolamina rubra TaxID=1380430 RepID=UPI0006790AC6|nr:hypothetical protein [Halolamina rubra]
MRSHSNDRHGSSVADRADRPVDPNVPLTATLLLLGAVALVGAGGAYRVTSGSSAADLAVVTRGFVYYVGDRAAVVPEWQFGAVPNVAEQER